MKEKTFTSLFEKPGTFIDTLDALIRKNDSVEG